MAINKVAIATNANSATATKQTIATLAKVAVANPSAAISQNLSEMTSLEKQASASLNPILRNSLTARDYSKNPFGELDLEACLIDLRKKCDEIKTGNLGKVEEALIAQANTLDAIFNFLAQKAMENVDKHMYATEMFMRLAYKAQGQCCRTLEALAKIKSPPVVFASQTNISNGQQQINNSIQNKTISKKKKYK
jgi:hypothetical protein